ncbi:RxLR effector protein [Phytophthora megakarya]|uniref:RxLR effector protein n=1 Tax=Phytophthora megakarya TaxID=4795 RepID=A0A225WCP5_9STRA|nr:RxLR effector protein [Phytophthora megakarya]
MRRSAILLFVVIIFVASSVDVTAGDNAIRTQSYLTDPQAFEGANTARSLKSTADNDEARAGAIANAVTKLKSLLRITPKNMQAAKNNPKGANEAITHVNTIIGKGKTSTELTPQKVKALETYAKSNPDKWYAMAYYLNYVFGIGLVAFLLYGTFYLGWRPLGLGGPRVN